jgi:L-2-hydroxyglutarate oxidase LhgO
MASSLPTNICVSLLFVRLQANGSLLLATTSDEVQKLEARAAMLQQQGVPGVVLLSPRELKMAEPALKLQAGSHGLLVKSDAQIVSQGLTANAASAAVRVSL